MKKVLFTGPIGGIYGRDVEANLVAKALENHYDLNFFSTGSISKNPVCIENIKNAKISSLRYQYLKNPVLYFFAFVSWLMNKFDKRLEDFSKNKVNAKLINKYNWDLKFLENQIKDKDLVICFVQISSSYLKEIIEICNRFNVKIIIRTTGQIKDCPIECKLIELVDLFIHHSISNKKNLEIHCKHNFEIIDQASTLEDKLLKIKPISKSEEFILGYLGRLEHGKGIIEIIDVAIKLSIKLIIAGDGVLREEIKKRIKSSENIKYIGYLEQKEIDKFFKNINVFLINSKNETGPLTGLEAMCASCFLISKKVGSMTTRLSGSKNIWIENENGLKNAINELMFLDRNLVIKQCIENRNIYVKNYSIDIIKEKYLKVINKLLNA